MGDVNHHTKLVLGQIGSIFKESIDNWMGYFLFSTWHVEGKCFLYDFFSDFRNELFSDIVENSFDDLIVDGEVVVFDDRSLN